MVAEEVLKLLSTEQSVRQRGEVDFILCVGDDRSDEDMFQTVKRFRDHARESPTPVLNSEDEVRPSERTHTDRCVFQERV